MTAIICLEYTESTIGCQTTSQRRGAISHTEEISFPQEIEVGNR